MTGTIPAVGELLARVRSQLAARADPEFRRSLQSFFKEPVDPYGVRTPVVRKIAAAVYRELKHRPPAERNAFCKRLWESGRMEEGAIAIYAYRHFRKQLGTCEFQLFANWIDRYVRNWAHCDGVACWLVAGSIENAPELIPRLASWTASRNRWKRRAAAVSLVQEAGRGRSTEAILGIAGELIGDPDEMVQKGVGWLLKEAYPRRPKEVVGFLQAWSDRAPRLVLRIAAEKMSGRDRQATLGRRK